MIAQRRPVQCGATDTSGAVFIISAIAGNLLKSQNVYFYFQYNSSHDTE